MTIMIIGSHEEYHARYIYDKLRSDNVNCFYLDTRSFPERIRLNLTPADCEQTGTLKIEDNQIFKLEDIRSVYWRYHHGIVVSPKISSEISSVIYREIESAMGSMFRNMPNALWVNPPSAIERHRYKTHQLFLMNRSGIPIPDTLVSNDPDEIRGFYDKHNGQVIYKPVSGGAHTAMLKPDDLTDERLTNLRTSPVQFQEKIDGTDIRVYLIGNNLFAAEIQAGTLDFRDNPDAPIVPITLPKTVEDQCRVLAELFEYKFTGIDIKRTSDNRYIFLEGNPSPMFVHFEKQSGYPISDTLVALLKAGNK